MSEVDLAVTESQPASPTLPELSSVELAGNEIRGRVAVRSGGPPRIELYDGDILLDAPETAPLSDDDNEPGNFSFHVTLPAKIYDTEAHSLRIHCDGAWSDALCFIGDPRLLMPKRARELLKGARAQAASTPGSTADGAGITQGLIAVMNAVNANSQALQALVAHQLPGAAPGRAGMRDVREIGERYGTLFHEAAVASPHGRDFVWLGVIDWAFRIQRPQHLAANLADLGNRVFYVSIVFESADENGRFRVLSSPYPGVFEIRLRVSGDIPNVYQMFSDKQLAEIQLSLEEAVSLLHVSSPTVVVQYPSWHLVAAALPGAAVVHDCLDLVEGFSNVPPEVVDLEEQLVASADLVVVSSQPLAVHVEKQRPCVVVRNAAEVKFFAAGAAAATMTHLGRRPVVGYFGAISDWFDVEWVDECAAAHPEWDFVLVGGADADISALRDRSNIDLLGELPYAALPERLADFDVAVIPFKLKPLILCTNPVKLYEYMAAGKPVVASPMPEVLSAAPGLVYIAKDAKQFGEQIEKALSEDTDELREARKAWARQHDWRERAKSFLEAVDTVTPKVSVVVLCHNNWKFTKHCLRSVLLFSDYPELEVIVVDNASTDETGEGLSAIAALDDRVRIITLPENVGFAAGNNAGLAAASGDYLILLNNDTYATRGWVRDLIRPLRIDPKLGLAGPLTNNIGNEQKVAIEYADMQEMSARSRAFVKKHLRQRWETENLAFFCVATRRDVIEKVGMLDEAFGLGFFEDDDYCKRVLEAGYTLAVVDDVFIHHHLSASFDALGAESKRKLMEKNKALFCSKWQHWNPHKYRAAPGFGQ